MKRFRPKLASVFLLLATGISVECYGQRQAIAPPSPQGGALMRSINIPVSYYTGTASINLPLYIAGLQGIQIPIQLDYQASGIKVNDAATWVGLGWRLVAGGRITRMVKGGPDEKGFCRPPSLTSDGCVATDLTKWTIGSIGDRLDNHFDSEADLFYFELPGASGRFFVDYNGHVWDMPYQNMKIEWCDKTLPSNYFKITDNSGTQYIFKSIETTQYQFNDEKIVSFPSTWNLTQVITQTGEKIDFTYVVGPTIYNLIENISTSMLDNEVKEVQKDYSHITIYPQYLRKILWRNGAAEFVADSIPYGNSYVIRLREMQINAQNRRLKSFAFDYNTFPNGSLQLVNVQENNDNLEGDRYTFLYNTGCNLPGRSSHDTDHFGYYNGPNSSKGYNYPKGGFSEDMPDKGADKEPHWPYTMADMLTEIQYKGGGRKVFRYESQAADECVSAGVRIKQIEEYSKSDDLNPRITKYIYQKSNDGMLTNISSGEVYSSKVNYASGSNMIIQGKSPYTIYNSNNDYIYDVSGSAIVYSEVREVLPNGAYNIYQYTSFHTDQCNDIQPKKYKINREGFFDQSSARFGINCPQTSCFFRRGLLLEQNSYSASGAQVVKTINRYDFTAPSKKEVYNYFIAHKYMDDIDKDKAKPIYYMGRYNWVSQPVYLDSTIVIQGPYNLYASTEHLYDTTYLTSKSSIQRDAEGNLFTISITHPFDYGIQSGFASPMQSALTMMQRRNMRTMPVESISYKNGKITGAELTLYRMSDLPDSAVLADRKLVLKLDRPIDQMNFTKSSIKANGTFSYDSRYEVTTIYDKYDNWGNPTCSHTPHGSYQSVIYGYDHSLPIAQVKNAQGGGSEDYTTEQDYSFMANASPVSRSISVNTTQTIRLEIDLAIDSLITIPGDCTADLVLRNTSTGQTQTYSPEIQSFGSISNCRLLFTMPVSPGNYSMTLNINMIPVISWNLTGRYTLSTLHHSDARDKEIFHTSFEEGDEGAESSTAKTGSRIHNGTYTVDTRNFIPGTYKVVYWESSDGGSTWQRIDQTMQVTSSSTSYEVGVSGKSIDELRILPARAEMTTYTHLPGIGMTSQTDLNGNTVYYEYDALGRLSAIRDNERRLLKSYQYQ